VVAHPEAEHARLSQPVIANGGRHDSAPSRRDPGLASSTHVDGWREVTDAVHAHRTPIIAQLMHAGALSQVLRRTAGPSAVHPRERRCLRRRHRSVSGAERDDTTDIEAVITGFAEAAANAPPAGFDGVEIHAANGYLLDQFITSYTNLRTDDYGGGPEERVRLSCEVAAAIRRQSARTSCSGYGCRRPRSMTLITGGRREEGEAIFAAVSASGIDYLHIASEGRDWHETPRSPRA